MAQRILVHSRTQSASTIFFFQPVPGVITQAQKLTQSHSQAAMRRHRVKIKYQNMTKKNEMENVKRPKDLHYATFVKKEQILFSAFLFKGIFWVFSSAGLICGPAHHFDTWNEQTDRVRKSDGDADDDDVADARSRKSVQDKRIANDTGILYTHKSNLLRC